LIHFYKRIEGSDVVKVTPCCEGLSLLEVTC